MEVNAELLLSRPSYHAGTPVVGTVLICRADIENGTLSRVDLASARLYLAGRAHLGPSCRWRSAQEIARLKEIYGEHVCLTVAKMEDRQRWDTLNSDARSRGGGGEPSGQEEAGDGETSRNCGAMTTAASFGTVMPAPEVTHVEQAERFAVDFCLHQASAMSRSNHDVGDRHESDHRNDPRNDYSRLPNPRDDNVICFWMTNVLEILDVPKRHPDRTCGRGRHGDMNPYRPLKLPDLNVVKDVFRDMEKHAREDSLLEGNQEEASLASEGSVAVEQSVVAPTVASAAARAGVPTATTKTCADVTTAAPEFKREADPKVAMAVAETNSSVAEAENINSPCTSSAPQIHPNTAESRGSSISTGGDSAGTLNVCNSSGRFGTGNNGERKEGSAPTSPHSSTPETGGWEQIMASASRDGAASVETPTGEIQFALSFRADLSADLPPTINCECIKYFYSAVLVVTTAEGELVVAHRPFAVLTPDPLRSPRRTPHQTSRVHVGDLRAVAHSAALPAHVSSTETSDATPTQLHVAADPPCCDIVSLRTSLQRTSTHLIADGRGRVCGSMTLVGLGGPLVPGTRLGVRVTFPIDGDDGDDDAGAGTVPCHRVCCALVGEEHAIFEGSDDTNDNLQEGKKRVKTRSYVFDSSFEMVECGATQAISMGLVLPLDCPVTVRTQLVEVTVTLKVEFTVSGEGEGGYNAIRLDLPVEVVHDGGGAGDDPGEGEREEQRVSSLSAMRHCWVNNDDTEGQGFEDTDIQTDLKMLSLRMIGDLAA